MNESKPRSAWLLLVLQLAMLSSACSTPVKISTGASMQLPTKPQSLQPEPSQDYSVSVSQDIERWEKQLTDILPTLEPALRPGQSK